MRSGMCGLVIPGGLWIILALNLPVLCPAWADDGLKKGEGRDPIEDQETWPRMELGRVITDSLSSSSENEEYKGNQEPVEIADPIYCWNKGMYHFNDRFYFWILKPVARGYRWAVPEAARTGVKNFFHNLGFPIRFVSCLLQAKGSAAAGEFGRFVMNTTCGVLGLADRAKDCPGLTPPEEDLGQTLGIWGMGNGFYIVWPFLGASTARDSMGLLGDSFLDPLRYVEPTGASMALTATDVVNKTSFRIGDYEALKEAAIDPYISIRDAYLQQRKKQVRE